MVACFFPSTHFFVYACAGEAGGEFFAKEEVVDAQAGIAAVGVAEIIPECVDGVVWMKLAQGVGPALRDKCVEGCADFGSEEGVIHPFFRFVDVFFGRHDIVVAGEDHGFAGCEELGCVDGQPLEPIHFVVEFGAGGRVTIWQVKTADDDTIDLSLYITAVTIFRVTREHSADLLWLSAAGEDGDAVPTLLAMPDGVIACVCDGLFGEFFLGGL